MIPPALLSLTALFGFFPHVGSCSDGLSPPGGKMAASSSSLIFSLVQVHSLVSVYLLSIGLRKSLIVSL